MGLGSTYTLQVTSGSESPRLLSRSMCINTQRKSQRGKPCQYYGADLEVLQTNIKNRTPISLSIQWDLGTTTLSE